MLNVYDATMTALTPPLLTPISRNHLPADCEVICATLRLAQTLAEAHDAAAQTSGSWASLQSTNFTQWLRQTYDALALRGQEPATLAGLRVLDPFQERLIWEQVIRHHLEPETTSLFDVSALAATAAEAHALSINWGIAVGGSFAGAFANTEQERFRLWREDYIDRCQQQGLIDGSRLNATLIEHLTDPGIPLPNDLAFAGFDHFTPLEQRLQAQLQTRGCRLYRLIDEPCPKTPTLQVYQAADLEHECLAVAEWVAQQQRIHPASRLGIVAPDLASYRYPMMDALEDRLDPSLVLARHAGKPRPFNISLAPPLSSAPVVRTALTLLQAVSQQHAVEQSVISDLLDSPYWSTREEMDARARLDAAIREGVAPKAPLKRYASYVAYCIERDALQAPATLGHLNRLRTSAPGLINQSRLPSEWQRSIQHLLSHGGWLAERQLRSDEFQSREAFAGELVKLARLDQITGKITFSRAVTLLSQLCGERLFQPKTRGTPPVQILGVLEAAGQSFDALWIMGLTDNVWPPAARPNPLLAAEAQRAAGAPNACAAVQLDFARRIQQRLLESAPDIHISYPHQQQATTLQPSPLIPDVNTVVTLDPPPVPWATESRALAGQALEAIDDSRAPAIDTGDKVSGGTWLLRAQAICPAWGYYEYRLGAKALATPVSGLDARQRGTLVHDTLEFFWKATGDLATLQGMDATVRLSAITQAASTALARFNADQKHEALRPRELRLEQGRLIRLVDAWLQLERNRKTAFTVLETEGQREIVIDGIVAHLRIDRIDRLEDGRTLIIDYKTGATIDTRNWAGARITEPQLPIYAAIAGHPEGDIAGVAFALVHVNGPAFKGVGEDEHLLPSVHAISSDRGRRLFDEAQFPDWPSVLAHWHKAIHAVAREIREGDASIRITDPDDLRYCDVLPLLRIAEREQQLAQAIAETTEMAPV